MPYKLALFPTVAVKYLVYLVIKVCHVAIKISGMEHPSHRQELEET